MFNRYTRKCKITFIRHGATLCTDENRFLDSENYPPINETGKEEMEKISNWVKDKGLKIDNLYSSPQLRTTQSARILSKICKKDFEILDSLYNRKAGSWSGLSYDQVEHEFPGMLEKYFEHPLDFCPTGAEDISSLNKRIKETLSKIIEANIGNRIVIITHGDIIQSAVATALGVPAENQFKIHIPTGSATQISYYSDWASLVYSAYLPL